MNSKITFVPEGGLGNRMNAIAAAIRLAEDIHAQLEIIWFQDWGMGCRFDDVFQSFNKENVSLRNAGFLDKILYDRPRRKNFFLPKLFERMMFDKCISGVESCYSDADFRSVCKDKKTWLSAYCYFLSKEVPDETFSIFKPVWKIQENINQIAAKFPSRTIGIHIRRADNRMSIKESPTNLFIERMKQEDDNTHFYLATDSEEEKKVLKNIFGDRIITSVRKADRGTVSGIEDAVTDMFLLAKTNLIIGSYYSSFSETAALVGGVELQIIKRK